MGELKKICAECRKKLSEREIIDNNICDACKEEWSWLK
jgi:uncharacterized CHY-type Zn-finger protein